MQTYRITRFCCTSGLCVDCHQRGNHGDVTKRKRVVHTDTRSETQAALIVRNWRPEYDARIEPDRVIEPGRVDRSFSPRAPIGE